MYSSRPSTQNNPAQKKCLEMMDKFEDMISDFQLKNNSIIVTKKKIPKPRTTSQDFSTVVPQLRKAVEVLKDRLSSASPRTVHIPNFQRFKQSHATSSVLGPGFYDTKLPRIEQDHDFVAVPRLEDRIDHKLSTFKAKRKSISYEETSRMSIFDTIMPKTRQEIKERSRLHNEKIEINKAAAREIKEYYSEYKKVKLTAKLQRIKWLENKEEILEVKKSWRFFISSLAISTIFALKIKNFKIMKKRSKLFSKVFYYFCKFVGIEQKILMKRRRRISYRNVVTISEPVFKVVLGQASKFKNLVFSLCNKTNQVSNLMNLMFKWRRSARLVVEFIRSNSVIQYHRKHSLHLLCKKFALKSRQHPELTDFLRVSALPYIELDKILTNYIRDRLISHGKPSSVFSMHSKRDNKTEKPNSTLAKPMKKPEHELKFLIYSQPLPLLSYIMRYSHGPDKGRKTIRFRV